MNRAADVSYLLVDLTPFQKDLIEILISLNAKCFEQEFSQSDEGAKTSADEVETMYPLLSAKQMMYIFDSNFRAVANHPCLLVDHYMPRQFLRKEPNENLINTSDKFKRLQQLLFGFIERDRAQFPQLLKICLISHSVRELDLLEGLILGQRVRIKRLSGTSLYNERHVYDEKPTISKQGANESRDGTPFNDSGANKYTGYPRDDYDYSLKRQRRDDNKSKDDWLFLTTTAHLINDPTLLDDYEIDQIISFDPLLDPSLPAVENLNRKAERKIPIIKFLVADSPDHYILENTPKGEYGQFPDVKKSIDHFLRTRHLKRGGCDAVNYTEVVSSLLKGEQVAGLLPDIQLSPLGTSSSPYEPRISRLEFSNSQLEVNNSIYDIKSYQSELMNRVAKRFLDIQNESHHKLETLAKDRLRETDRQNGFEEMKANIALKFKRFQEVEKEITDSEKRLERSQTEAGKLEQRLNALNNDQDELKRLMSLADENDLASAIEKYLEQNTQMQIELNELESSNNQKSLQNEELRSEYQQKSSLAAEQALRLSTLKSSLEQLQKDATGPAPQIATEILKGQQARLKEELSVLKNESRFYAEYIAKMTHRYDLKLLPNDDGTSQSSSSSSLNGRSTGHGSRFRSTRSNTPTYT